MLRVSYVAFSDGLSHEIFPLVASIFTLAFSLHYYDKIALFVSENIIILPISLLNWIIFLALVVLAGFIFRLIKVILDKIIKVSWHPLIEKLGGLGAGVLRAAVLTSTILIILSLMPLSYIQRSIRDRSLTGMYFLRIGPSIYRGTIGLLPIARDSVHTVDAMVKNLVSDKSVFVNAKSDAKKAPEKGAN